MLMMVDFKKSKTPRHKKKSFRLFAGKFVCYEYKVKYYKANYELHELGWNGNMTEYDRTYKFQKPHFFLQKFTWANFQAESNRIINLTKFSDSSRSGSRIFLRGVADFRKKIRDFCRSFLLRSTKLIFRALLKH